MEAISILGSLLVIPDRLPSMPVLKPIPHEYGTVLCSDIKVTSCTIHFTSVRVIDEISGPFSVVGVQGGQTGDDERRPVRGHLQPRSLRLRPAFTRHSTRQSERRHLSATGGAQGTSIERFASRRQRFLTSSVVLNR